MTTQLDNHPDTGRFTSFMGRHFVALVGAYESFKDGQIFHRGVFTISGFILRLHDQLFWVTAGHCLKDELDEPILVGRLRVFNCGFADYFGDQVRDTHNIPYGYAPGCAFYINDESRGLDFAVIPLDYLTIQNLAANGIKYVSRENWIHQPGIRFDRFAMFGIPSHLTIIEHGEAGFMNAKSRAALLWVNQVESDDQTWFCGQIDPNRTIESIKGMSGGPIYGFRVDEAGQWTYHVVALQSWWKPDSRTIFGCSLPFFAELLHQAGLESEDSVGQ